MTQQNNGQLGDWALQCAQAKPIEIATKIACLELFRQGNGYRKAAKMLGLKQYTVRDWLRRFKSGDVSWSTSDGHSHYRCAEAKDLVQYRHEIEAFISGRGKDTACDGSGVGSGRPVRGRENQVAGGAEPPAAVPLYCAGGACERILPGGIRKNYTINAPNPPRHAARSNGYPQTGKMCYTKGELT